MGRFRKRSRGQIDPAREDRQSHDTRAAAGWAETLLGPADDALDADTSAVLTFSAAQAAAREWFALLDRNSGRRPEPYTVGQALDEYLANFTGKSLDKPAIRSSAT